jgi:ribokinase
MANRVVVVGSSNTDMIIQAARIPRPGETILGGQFTMAAGGKGANQAVAAARAGGQVAFVARVGEDVFGEQAVKGFAQDGIDVRHVVRDRQAPSGVALIFVAADGENSIGVASGANGRLSPDDVQAAADAIGSADVLVMQLETPLETVRAAARIAVDRKARVILNPAPAQALDDDLLKCVSILTPNETEAELLTGIRVDSDENAEKAARVLRGRGIKTVIITLGSRGVFVLADELTGIVPGFKVTPVDTTAAGDVFNGALAVSIGPERDLADAICFANAAAAISVTRLGAQPSAPKRAEIEAFLAAHASG